MDLFRHFSTAGRVVDIRIIRDKGSVRSRGVAYVEMGDIADVPRAIGLSGTELMGTRIGVKVSESEKNIAWGLEQEMKREGIVPAANRRPDPGAAAGLDTGPKSVRLRVTNLHPKLEEEDLRRVFGPFGVIESIDLRRVGPRDPSMAEIVYTDEMHGRAAAGMNGQSVAEMPISVHVWQVFPRRAAALPPAPGPPGAPDLDLKDHATVGRGAQAQLLMQRAAEAGIALPEAPPGAAAPGAGLAPPPHPMAHARGLLGPASPVATDSLLIKNMFDPAEENASGEGWDVEIAEDVKAECEEKYGPVLHIFVDPQSEGFVYLRFKTITGAQAAADGLQDRSFGGRRLFVEFAFSQTYKSVFKLQ